MRPHLAGARVRVLLSSVFKPFAQDDEFGSREINPAELYHNQVTRLQGPFSLRMFHRTWSLMLLQRNITAPSTVLDFPTRARFVRELTAHRYDVVGLTGIDPAVVEAARGMGMSGWQRFARVELPLTLPLLLAGARVATLSIIGIGTIAALINAGGLGQLLFEGVATGNRDKIIAGALAVSALAIGANAVLRLLERRAALAIRGEDA